jgi:hypothetical protein
MNADRKRKLIRAAEQVFSALERLHSVNWRTSASRQKAEAKLEQALAAWRALTR